MPSIEPLVSPRTYFEDTYQLLTAGTAVFFGYFMASMLLFAIVLELLLRRINAPPTGLRGELYGHAFELALLSLLIMVVAWVVVAAVMHFVGGAGTDGRFTHALGLAGFAYAPEIITMPLQAGVIWYHLQGVTFSGSDPAAMAAEVEALQAEMHVGLGILILLAVTAWSVFILARGIQGTHGADAEHAWAAALIVGIGSIFLAFIGAGAA